MYPAQGKSKATNLKRLSSPAPTCLRWLHTVRRLKKGDNSSSQAMEALKQREKKGGATSEYA